MADCGSDERYGMAKLEGESNYRTWKIQIKAMLGERRLWGYVEEKVTLKEGASEKEVEAFEHKMHSAYTKLIMSMTTPMVALCQACVTAKDVWTTITQQFEKNTNLAKLRIKKQHMDTKLQEGESAEVHIRVMKELTDRLAMMGSPVTEEDKFHVLLLSLPSSYDNLVTTLASPEILVYQTIVNGIIEFEMRTGGDRRNDLAMVGSAGNRSYPYHGNKHSAPKHERMLCHGCNRPGYFIRDCPTTQSRDGYESQPQPNNPPTRPRSHRPRPRNNRHKAKVACEMPDGKFVFCTERNGKAGKRSDWIIDSGASCHMTWEKELFFEYRELTGSTVKVGDGRTVEAMGEGTVRLSVYREDGKLHTLSMVNVLHVPELSCNLMSVRQITDRGFLIQFKNDRCRIKSVCGVTVAGGIKRGNRYVMEGRSERPEVLGEANVVTVSDRNLWHRRLCHIGDTALEELARDKVVTGVKIKDSEPRAFCDSCAVGKQHRTSPKRLGAIRAERKLQLVYSDVMGPVSVASMTNKRFMISFTDDKTRISSVAFMAKKSEALEKFKDFQATVEAESGLRIGTLRTDRGGEYVGKEFKRYLRSQQIEHEETIANTPEQNGVSERLDRTLMEKARPMVAHAALSKRYWAEAVSMACYIKNRSPSQSLAGHITPYEAWYGRKPDLSDLKVFGCIAYAHIPDGQCRKLDDKSQRMRFLGYSKGGRGYRLMEEKTGRIKYRRDVLFDENNFSFPHQSVREYVTHSSKSSEPVGDINPEAVQVRNNPIVDDRMENDPIDSDTSVHEPRVESPVVRPVRDRKKVKRYGVDDFHVAEVNFVHSAFSVESNPEPVTLKEAFASKDSEKWRAAAQAEYD